MFISRKKDLSTLITLKTFLIKDHIYKKNQGHSRTGPSTPMPCDGPEFRLFCIIT